MFNLSSSLKKSFTYIEPGTIRNDDKVRQIIVAFTILILVKSVKDILKALSPRPLVAKPLHLHEGHSVARCHNRDQLGLPALLFVVHLCHDNKHQLDLPPDLN